MSVSSSRIILKYHHPVDYRALFTSRNKHPAATRVGIVLFSYFFVLLLLHVCLILRGYPQISPAYGLSCPLYQPEY